MRTRKSQLSISTAVSVVIVVVIVAIAAIAAGFYFISPASTAPSKVCPYTSGQNVPIIFGATLSLTGSLSAFGQEQNWTLYQAVHDINSFGGIPLCNGAKGTVSLKVLDDGTDPAKASQNLQTLVSTDHAVVILGELGGVQDSTAQTFASQNKIPYVGPVYISSYKSCTSNCNDSWIFAPFQNETNEAHIFLDWFHSVFPPTNASNSVIAFFGEGDPAALANNKAGEAYAQQLGYTVCPCSDLNFQTGSTSEMNTFISSAKSDHAVAVYGLPVPPDAVLMANVAKELNYQPEAWLLTRGTAVAPFAVPQLGGVGNLSVGFMSSFPWHPLVPYQGNLLGHTINNSQIVSEYESYWGHPPTLEGVYYTEALIAADAIKVAGDLVNTDIRSALLSTTFQTVMGTVKFTPGGQWIESQQYILLMQWQNVVQNGRTIQALQLLEPTSISTTNYIIYPFSWTSPQTHPWPPSGTASTST
jgi:ABC-type branched-subunit amino acid transport system substrate-binding protein